MRDDHPSPLGGIVRGTRRPVGWTPPGPRPPREPERAELWPRAGEDLCWLAGDFRILQRLDGHRWSLDDLATAWFAARCLAADPAGAPAPAPRRILDLGCGIGTVLLFHAWRFVAARLVGVEAQEVSVELARRSLAWNRVTARAEVRHGDFRAPALTPEGAAFDLVTGTPPYFPPGTGLQSSHVQRAPCRFEHRGGVEDYCVAAARLLAPGGRFVACQAASQAGRVAAGARAAGLALEAWCEVVPRAGKAPLFYLFTLARPADARPTAIRAPLVVRGAEGRWTDEFRALREQMGLPPGANDACPAPATPAAATPACGSDA
jgi:tRNA1(Val) A37 N6-methylase TrmN6